MRDSVLAGILLTFAGCGTMQQSVQKSELIISDRDSTNTRIDTVRTEHTITIRPARVEVEAQRQESVSVGRDSSHLETDYSQSDAWIDGDGRLNHTIANKESFVVVVPEGRIEERISESATSVQSATVSTHKESEHLERRVVEKTRFLDWLFYPAGVISVITLLVYTLIKSVTRWRIA